MCGSSTQLADTQPCVLVKVSEKIAFEEETGSQFARKVLFSWHREPDLSVLFVKGPDPCIMHRLQLCTVRRWKQLQVHLRGAARTSSSPRKA
ncbi:hypothetical protein AK812_SmicGene15440 [Symbiodinium microadriaticum]|uniref:Uncharacterized protein n=1 Tax=Symbiodinium microadriaticum TaxID=2951 RepID=A0A1Q9E2W2_SYMMI|nr:hypothetical protein AK812_SmicGene15440 [Symbiodinium microadriaticum]